MDIILFGMQGSGKGTQGKLLAQKYNLKVFDTGEHLRNLIDSDHPLSEKLKGSIESGELVDDEHVMGLVEKFLNETPQSQPILFDGVPRRLSQAKLLQDLLVKHHRDAFAVFVRINETEGFKRLTQRRICPTCKGIYPANYSSDICQHCGSALATRSDDHPEGIKTRIENYQKNTLPVIKTFYDRDRLIEVDGEQPIEGVSKEMVEKVAYLFT